MEPAPATDDARAADTASPAARATPPVRALWTVLALGAWAVLATAAWLRPDVRGYGTHEQLGLSPCSFSALTGIPCPGCGLTTAFAHMAHGHPLAAFAAHPMGPLLFLLTLAAALYGPWAALRARPFWAAIERTPTVVALVLTASAGLLTFALRVMHVLRVP